MGNSIRQVFYFVIVFLLLGIKTDAQLKCKIEYYSTEEGLSHGAVTSILKDREGFMWFGTWNGINRFDGHNFESYKSVPGDMSQLGNDRIDKIVEDDSNHLWLKAYDKQIYCFNKKSEQFVPLSNVIRKKGERKITFEWITVSDNGTVWLISTKEGLIAIPGGDLSRKNYLRYKNGLGQDYQLPSNVINFLREDRDHRIWVGTSDGLACLVKSASGIYKNIKLDADIAKGQDFTAFAEGKDQLFFSTRKGELVIYDKISKEKIHQKISSHQLNALRLSKKSNSIYASTSAGELITVNLNNQKVTTSTFKAGMPFLSIYEDRTGCLWIEPEQQGVVRFDPEHHSFQYFSQKNDAKYNYSGNHFRIFEDNNNIVWVNMKGGGFGFYNSAKATVDYFHDNPDDVNHRFSNIVSALYYDKKAGILWFSTDEWGINKITFQRNDFNQQLLVDPGTFKSDNEVRGIFYDHKDRLWLGVKSGKLYIYKNDKRITGLFVNEPSEGLGQVYCILQDHKGNIWLGTKSNGLFKASPVNKEQTKYRLDHFLADNDDINSLSSNEIYALLEDRKGRIWVGTFDKGLNLVIEDQHGIKFSHTGNTFKHYPVGAFHKIRHMALDKDGYIWIGTTDGLLLMDAGDNHSQNYSYVSYSKIPGDKQSLGNNDVQFIYRDSRNTMWLATAGGGLDHAIGDQPFKSLKFKDYTTKEGLPNNYVLSCTEDKYGNLWLATQNGLSRFNVAKKQFKNYDSYNGLPKTNFSEASCFKLPNGNLVFGTAKGYLRFNPGDIVNSRISANMVLTNLQINNEDIDPNANNTVLNYNLNYVPKLTLKHNQNIISIDYTVLDHRSNNKQTYAYYLKGFDTSWHNNKGVGRATYTNLPPGEYVFEVKSLNNDLYSNTPYKSLELVILPPPWRTWWAYLIYLTVIVLLTEAIRRITLTVLRLRNKIAVEQKLAALKLSFFTNVSHELRTPLTLILNPIEEISRKEKLSPQGVAYVDIVRKNANRMVRFINQLLDLRKLQSGKVILKISRIEVISFLRKTCEYFAETASKKQINLQIVTDLDELFAWVDVEKLDIVIYNLLANAFKFTPNGKDISLIIRYKDTGQSFLIEVYDQGQGVDEDKLNDIFELYYEGNHKEGTNLKGTGIGLALSKELILLHGGNISAGNNAENGLTVTVELKVGKDHFKPDEVTFVDQPQISEESGKTMEDLLLSKSMFPAVSHHHKVPLVLLVEDNADLRTFLKEQLNEYYRVEVAEDGEEGWQKALLMVPDLILSDVMMPKMDGIQLLDKLKNDLNTSHIPVVLLSAKTSIENQIEGLKYGADYYITKPFHNDFLMVSIDNLLRQRKKMFDSLLEKKEKIELSPEAIVITSKDEAFLKEVIRIVENGMTNPEFSIDAVAETIGMGRTTFYKKFKSLTNLAPVEFVREMRLQRGKQYLDAGEKNISIIAYAVGFNDAKYFSICFKKKYCVSPSDYLKSRKS